jgi:hypothetical protein
VVVVEDIIFMMVGVIVRYVLRENTNPARTTGIGNHVLVVKLEPLHHIQVWQSV